MANLTEILNNINVAAAAAKKAAPDIALFGKDNMAATSAILNDAADAYSAQTTDPERAALAKVINADVQAYVPFAFALFSFLHGKVKAKQASKTEPVKA